MHITPQGIITELTTEKISQMISSVQDCRDKQDITIAHEFTFDLLDDAEKMVDIFLDAGFLPQMKTYDGASLGFGAIYYVGVPFETLKKN